MAEIITKKRFGDILVEGGLINQTQLQQALNYSREREIKLGKSLLELGYVNDRAVAKTLAKQLDLPFADFKRIVVDPQIVPLIPETLARKFKLIAIGRRPGEVLVAFTDPLNIFAFDELRHHIHDKIVICVAMESGIVSAIETYYPAQDESLLAPGDKIENDESEAVNIINDILLRAAREEASDIHLEPGSEKVRIRIRVDGLLKHMRNFPMEMLPSLVSRIKIMSQLDIGERRKPQDGRFEIPISGREFDIRVSTLPLNNGEKVVLRLLDKSKVKIGLHDLGFEPEQQKIFENHLKQPHEIILVTGPTGSGKTTTLYAALNQINSVEKNIVTVEDPVEYELKGINQVQVNPKANLTFVSALRSILRQDPDVVMIGEIRDVETAEIAIQAALTGHLVLSTLHTNDASGAVARLIDMSIPPFLIASSVGLVLAQRLIRKLCSCRESFQPEDNVMLELGLDHNEKQFFFRPTGCPKCEFSGYRGRLAIYEVLTISTEIESLIMKKGSSHELYRQGRKEGMMSLRDSGLKKVISGITSLDEVLRITLNTMVS